MARLKDTAHRIDRAPVLFLGCSGAEIMTLVLVGLLSGIVSGILIGFLTSWWISILPCAMLGAFLSVYKGAPRLAEKKEGKPDGYYNKIILFWLSDKGFLNLFINRDGYWSIRK